jgi:hypothetical protein
MRYRVIVGKFEGCIGEVVLQFPSEVDSQYRLIVLQFLNDSRQTFRPDMLEAVPLETSLTLIVKSGEAKLDSQTRDD